MSCWNHLASRDPMTLARKHSLVCLVILWLYVVGCVQENETRRLWTAPGQDCFPADPAAPWAKCLSWPRPHITKALHQDRNWMWRGRDIWTSDKTIKVEVCTGGVSVLESALLTTVTLPSLTASSRDKFKLQNCSEEATTLASWLLCSCFWSHKRISASNQCLSSTQNQVAIAICQTVQAEQQEEKLANVHKQGDKRSPKAKAKSYVHHKIRNKHWAHCTKTRWAPCSFGCFTTRALTAFAQRGDTILSDCLKDWNQAAQLEECARISRIM